MDMKKLAYTIMTFSFILLMSGGVSSFVVGLKQDRKEISKRVIEVNDTFEVFSANTSVFESFRDNLYEDTLSKLFLDTMYQDDKSVKEKLSNYEQLVDELTKNVKELNRLCDNIYYPDSTVNSKCKNYKTIYEQVINYFVSDIEEYNQNIDKYNEYQTKEDSLLRLRRYYTSRNYVDYNLDGMFDGKGE